MWNSILRHSKQVKNLSNIIRHESKAKTQECMPHMNSWQVHSYGEELQCTSVRVPIIQQATDVLVEIAAASVNPIDTYMKGK